MSVEAITWAMKTDCPSPTAKLVLICLANYANGNGLCHPGQQKLSQNSGLSKRQIIRVMKLLEDAGIILRERRNRDDGSRTSDRYQLIFGQSDNLAPDILSKVTFETSQGDTMSPQYIPNGISEPSVEPKETRARARFDVWYSEYPHKVGKEAARKAFEKAIAKTGDVDPLIEGLRRYIESKPPDRPWCNPATWLNQERWDDEPARNDQNGTNRQISKADQRDDDIRNFREWAAKRHQECFASRDATVDDLG